MAKRSSNPKLKSKLSIFFTERPRNFYVALGILLFAGIASTYLLFNGFAADQNIVNVAASQVGVTESPKGSNRGPAVDVYTQGHAEPWCADFVSWVYEQAGKPIGHIPSVATLREFFQGQIWHNRGDGDVPQAGDVVIFINDGHTGIVDHVEGATVVMIEGNYSDSVARTGYNYNTDSSIVGWGRLPGGSTPVGSNPAPPPKPQPPVVVSNSGGIIRGVQSQLCIDVPGGQQTDGTQLHLYTCLGNTNQQWFNDGWNPASGGQLRVYANKCMELDGNQTANGTRITIYTCNGAANQKWIAKGDKTLRPILAPNKCVDAAGQGTAIGTKLILWDCGGGTPANQQWLGTPAPNGGGALINNGSNRCVDVPGSRMAPGIQPFIYGCSGQANQQWQHENGRLRVFSDKCLDVYNPAAPTSSPPNGTIVVTNYCHDGANQKWTWGADGLIRSALDSNKCLEVEGANNTQDGTRLHVWACTGAGNQLWRR